MTSQNTSACTLILGRLSPSGSRWSWRCSMCSTKLCNADRHIASAAFFAVVSFEAKLAMTDAAAIVALHDTAPFGDWAKLSERTRTNQPLRNHLVHFQLNQETTRNPKAKYRLRLTPNFFDALKTVRYAEDAPPVYDLQQIRNFTDQFATLATDLTSFAERLPMQPP